jgi:DNA-binding NtrC family response regulator
VGTGYHLLLIGQRAVLTDSLLRWVQELGTSTWQEIDWTSCPSSALREHKTDLIITLVPGYIPDALRLFQWYRNNPMPVPKIAVLPYEPTPDLWAAGVGVNDDFLLAPVREEEFFQRVARLLRGRRLPESNGEDQLVRLLGMNQIVGCSQVFVRTIEQIPRIANSGLPVVITGETGTGKELCARAIHHLSPRRNGAFVAVDCSTVPDHLFENELFGHAQGAYTDAHTEHKGLVAVADGGTLLLDECDSLSLGAQAKLLRFLQDKNFRPLGSNRYEHAEVRVIAASNLDLESCVREKNFREDLYYRLNVVRLHIPPLRERSDDIELLANHFLEYFGPKGERCKRLLPSALCKLKMHHWPGNIRELANVMHRAIWLAAGADILPSDLDIVGTGPKPGTPLRKFRDERAQVLRHFEHHYVEQLLLKHNGNVTHAAAEAGKERRAFGRLIKKYSISRVSV